nr:PAS domain S-box protein [candidate division Zixibacteria bacterium]
MTSGLILRRKTKVSAGGKKKSKIKDKKPKDNSGIQIKELGCLYRIALLHDNQELSVNEYLREVVNLIPTAFDFPDEIAAWIVFGDFAVNTSVPDYTESDLATDIWLYGERVGVLKILAERSDVFVDRHKNFLETVARAVATHIARLQAEEELRARQERLKIHYLATFEGIVVHDNGIIIDINPAFVEMFGFSREELIGNSVYIIANQDSLEVMQKNVITGHQEPYEAVCRKKNGQIIHTEIIAKEYHYEGRKIRVAAFRDVSTQKKTISSLEETRARLLTEQITLRKKNIALKEVLEKIEEEKQQIKKRLQSNVDSIIMPVIHNLKVRLDDNHRRYIDLLEDSLTDITAPFIDTLETNFRKLSPREIEICNLIKSGRSSKDIAAILGISYQTVDKQRTSIRRKLKISGQAINLESYLKTITTK